MAAALNSCATLISLDIVKRLRPDTSDARMVTIGRITTGVIMVLAMLWSTQGDQFGTIFEAINKIPMTFAPAVTTVFVLGVMWKRGTKQAAMATLYLGSLIGVIYFLLDLPGIGKMILGAGKAGAGFSGLVTDPAQGLGIPFMLVGPDPGGALRRSSTSSPACSRRRWTRRKSPSLLGPSARRFSRAVLPVASDPRVVTLILLAVVGVLYCLVALKGLQRIAFPNTFMKRNLLGKTGLHVSALSFGASALGGVFGQVDEAEGIRAVHAALDLGINYFDVSPAYGATRSETVLGKALKGIARDRYYLSTKVGKYTQPGGYGDDILDYSRARIRASLDESAARLGTDYFDLIHIHDIEYQGRQHTDWALNEGLAAVRELKREGRIGAVSFGIYPMDLWHRIFNDYEVDAALVHNHYCLHDTRLLELLPLAKTKASASSTAPHLAAVC